jgi:hypothetical protein
MTSQVLTAPAPGQSVTDILAQGGWRSADVWGMNADQPWAGFEGTDATGLKWQYSTYDNKFYSSDPSFGNDGTHYQVANVDNGIVTGIRQDAVKHGGWLDDVAGAVVPAVVGAMIVVGTGGAALDAAGFAGSVAAGATETAVTDAVATTAVTDSAGAIVDDYAVNGLGSALATDSAASSLALPTASQAYSALQSAKQAVGAASTLQKLLGGAPAPSSVMTLRPQTIVQTPGQIFTNQGIPMPLPDNQSVDPQSPQAMIANSSPASIGGIATNKVILALALAAFAYFIIKHKAI